MDRVRFSSLAQLRAAPMSGPRKLALPLGVIGLPLMGLGCAQLPPTTASSAPTVVVARAAGAETAEPRPARSALTAASVGQPSHAVEQTTPAKSLAINLDTVFHLAEDQNPQVALARARVQEASAEKDVAASSWLPSLNVGTAYWRHEGGIANEDGTLTRSSFGALFAGLELTGRLDLREAVYQKVNAERLLWQQKGELRRVTSETLLDAADTYVDLLAARSGEAIAVSMQKELQDLLVRAQKLTSVEPGASVEVARLQAALRGRDQTVLELRALAARASAKLAYLLGLDPCLTLIPVDAQLVPLKLVNAAPPVADLVAQALATGPGIREMEGLLALIHESIERSNGPGRLFPVVEMRMAEGGFGTGPGARSDWENRWDFGVQARWNLTEHLTRWDREKVIQAKTEQAHLAYQDLRAKLTLGVQESREAILSGSEQMRLTREQIREAQRAHKLSDDRLKNNVPGNSVSEVLLSLQAVALAQTGYLNIVRAYDKAQLRLLILLGPPVDRSTANGNCPTLSVNGQ